MLSIRPLAATLAALLAMAGTGSLAIGQDAPKTKTKTAKKAAPTGPPPPATPIDKIKVPKGFKVELLYTVPRETQGSWVNLTVDPKGRLITSDQYGKLYRVTPPAIGAPASEIKVEPIAVEIGEAQGLLWAFDSLYVVVNTGGKFPSGLYRVRDTDGDDKLDKVEQLRKLEGSGEHGPHGVVLAPDGKSLYIVAGNATRLPEISGSLVPKNYGEDNLLPRMVDGRGFMTNEKAPGGYICKVDPDGKNWELVSMGYRNAYDLAFNRSGDLFTYDSDMEWDMNTPWYRPTRVNLVASGADYGYRNGAGKWPTYYFDSLPQVVNIGPGSPTGVCFGYGAKFPSKYQDALYLCDWSYGKLYAAILKPDGSGYTADLEEFMTGTPLPLTDVVIDPKDGAMYFAIGGPWAAFGRFRVPPAAAGDRGGHQQAGRRAGRDHRRGRLRSAADGDLGDRACPCIPRHGARRARYRGAGGRRRDAGLPAVDIRHVPARASTDGGDTRPAAEVGRRGRGGLRPGGRESRLVQDRGRRGPRPGTGYRAVAAGAWRRDRARRGRRCPRGTRHQPGVRRWPGGRRDQGDADRRDTAVAGVGAGACRR